MNAQRRSIPERLAGGELVHVMFMGSFASPGLVELAGRIGGIDGVLFDQEHAAIPHAELENLLRACRAAGLEGISRVAPSDYATVMRPMEAGASGVMVAQIREVEEVRRAVQWTKYPPRGVRGLFLGNYEAGFGTIDAKEHIERANRERWLLVQIETAEAVENVDAIAAVEGVDCLFVGPGDLACALGVPGEPLHPRCVDALERVSGAAKRHGRSWGVLPRNIEHAEKCRALGCQLFSALVDLGVLQLGFAAARERFAGLFGPAEH